MVQLSGRDQRKKEWRGRALCHVTWLVVVGPSVAQVRRRRFACEVCEQRRLGSAREIDKVLDRVGSTWRRFRRTTKVPSHSVAAGSSMQSSRPWQVFGSKYLMFVSNNATAGGSSRHPKTIHSRRGCKSSWKNGHDHGHKLSYTHTHT